MRRGPTASAGSTCRAKGLILVTNDGELANGITHPKHGVEKIYHVQVAGKLDEEGLKQLRKGMHLAEGFAQRKARPHQEPQGERARSSR